MTDQDSQKGPSGPFFPAPLPEEPPPSGWMRLLERLEAIIIGLAFLALLLLWLDSSSVAGRILGYSCTVALVLLVARKILGLRRMVQNTDLSQPLLEENKGFTRERKLKNKSQNMQ